MTWQRFSRLFWQLIALASAVACGPRSSDPGTDGVLHFLTACAADEQCGADLTCACGVCTQSCIASSECSALAGESETAHCVSANSACESSTPSGPAAPTGGLCTLGCSDNADCAGQGLATLVCEDERCVAPPETPEPPLKLTCQTGTPCVELECAKGENETITTEGGCCLCEDPCRSGPPVAVDAAVMANRLSVTIFGEVPSADFTARVTAGKLDTAGAVGCFAREMLGEPMAAKGIELFIENWIGPFDLVPALERAAIPTPTETAASMREATFAFASEAILRGDGLLSNLLLDRYAFLNDLNGQWYEEVPRNGRTLTRVDLDVSQRVGLFTREYFLAGTGRGTRIVGRGLAIINDLLCQEVPPPPPGAAATLPLEMPMGVTLREKLSVHVSDPVCTGCHSIIDPIGYAFGHFNELGAFQLLENGVPIDTSAEISGGVRAGVYAGIEDMMAAFARDPEVHACVVEHYFNHAFQRPPGEVSVSRAAQALVQKATNAQGFSLREMIVLTTETPGFIGVPRQ